jgi:hypothetical protein
MKIPEQTIRNRALMDGVIDEEARKVSFIIVSADNGNIRTDYWNDREFEEVLDVNGATWEGLNTFFKDHDHSVDTAIGKVENVRIEDGQIKADVIFGRDDESFNIFRKYRDGILTDVSIGYKVKEYNTQEREGALDLVTITSYDIVELSAVWRGFDRNAKVGREAQEKEAAKIRAQQVQNRMKFINLSL